MLRSQWIDRLMNFHRHLAEFNSQLHEAINQSQPKKKNTNKILQSHGSPKKKGKIEIGNRSELLKGLCDRQGRTPKTTVSGTRMLTSSLQERVGTNGSRGMQMSKGKTTNIAFYRRD